jgi:rRNA-processing protein FCF1
MWSASDVPDLFFDSSFLIYLLSAPGKSTMDVLEDYPKGNWVTSSAVLSELRRLASKQRGRVSKAAKRAVSLLEERIIRVVDFNNNDSQSVSVDDSIVAYALSHKSNTVVATVDHHLALRLKSHGVRVIQIRGKRLVPADC